MCKYINKANAVSKGDKYLEYAFIPYWKTFNNQYQNNTRTSKNYIRASIKHTGSGII